MQHFAFLIAYRLTLAWVTSEKFYKATGMLTHLDSIFFTVAGSHLMLTRLSAPVSTAPVRVSSLTPVSSFVQPTLFSRPVTTSDHAEISSPKPFVWFRTKTDKGIVCLAGHLHSVTVPDRLCYPPSMDLSNKT